MNYGNIVVLLSIIVVLSITHTIAFASGYDKAVTSQIKKDEKVVEVLNSAKPEAEKADQEYTEEKTEIKEESEKKFSQLELEAQYKYGLIAGRKEERDKQLQEGFSDEEIKRCFDIVYPDDSGVLKSARSLQQEVINGNGGYEVVTD